MRIVGNGVVYDASIANENRRFACFISLSRVGSQRLLCTFKVGSAKVSADDNLVIMQSDDSGRTWKHLYSCFETTFAGVKGCLNSGYIFERSPSNLMISCMWVDRTDPTLPLANPQTTGLLPLKCLLAESSDGGVQWSGFREVSLKPHKAATPTCEILRLRNGSIMLPYESWRDWDDTAGIQSANIRLSADNGRNWSSPITIASDPAQKLYFWDNRIAIEPETGELVAFFWTHDSTVNCDAPIHISRGLADASKWTSPASTNVAGQIAAPVVLPGRRLLMFYVHRHEPCSMRAVVSGDFGKTWQLNHELVVYQSGGKNGAGMAGQQSEAEYWEFMYHWTFGHPKGIYLGDNRVLVVYYAGDKNYLSIRWAQIEIW